MLESVTTSNSCRSPSLRDLRRKARTFPIRFGVLQHVVFVKHKENAKKGNIWFHRKSRPASFTFTQLGFLQTVYTRVNIAKFKVTNSSVIFNEANV